MPKAETEADRIIAALDLHPHPEGGWYRQTWVAAGPGRPTGTCIYFLLRRGEQSHWHRVDADEIWLYHAGAPLILSLAQDLRAQDLRAQAYRLGPDVLGGAHPQIIVPRDWWQAAQTTGDWTLVSCTVSPGFDFAGFELAPPGFHIPVDTDGL